VRKRILLGTDIVPILFITSIIRLGGASGFCFKTKTENFCFYQHTTSLKIVVMATAQRVSFCFFCDAHLWCQVSRTLFQNFQRYRLFSIFLFLVANSVTSSISLKLKKIFQKEGRHSSVFWKAFQISTNYFSFREHFNKFNFSQSQNTDCRQEWNIKTAS